MATFFKLQPMPHSSRRALSCGMRGDPCGFTETHELVTGYREERDGVHRTTTESRRGCLRCCKAGALEVLRELR